jgi:hypothetical protein
LLDETVDLAEAEAGAVPGLAVKIRELLDKP